MAVTKTVSNATLVIEARDGFSWITFSVLSTSTAGATVLGNGKFANGIQSDAITIEAGQSFTTNREATAAIELTIVAPSGCTISFYGQ